MAKTTWTPRGYDDIKLLAKKAKVPMRDSLALARSDDPFFARLRGAEAQGRLVRQALAALRLLDWCASPAGALPDSQLRGTSRSRTARCTATPRKTGISFASAGSSRATCNWSDPMLSRTTAIRPRRSTHTSGTRNAWPDQEVYIGG